jgi:hypothetical protein
MKREATKIGFNGVRIQVQSITTLSLTNTHY